MQHIQFFRILVLAIFVSTGCANQHIASTSPTSFNPELIDQQNFTFIAQNVTPTEDSRFNPRLMLPNGNNLYQLTSGYDIKITPDSVIAFLPFYGRSFTAPIDPSKGGIKFTSTNFGYQKSMKKKNYEITITPKDVPDIRAVYITISQSGYASVNVSSLNKTPISYTGVIQVNH